MHQSSKNALQAGLLAITIAGLGACGGGHPVSLPAGALPTQPQGLDRSVDVAERIIAPSIVGDERATMRRLIQSAPRKIRALYERANYNNVYITYYNSRSGQFYVNRPEIRGALTAYKTVNGTLYRNSEGHTITVPIQQNRPTLNDSGSRQLRDVVISGVDHGSGPYRRVYTWANHWVAEGQFEITSILHIPCNAGKYARPSGEAGYAYLGGWGSTGWPIDAGVFDARPQTGQDQYQMFVNNNGTFLA